MTTLVELNALRVANGMKPLKAWKESKAKLDEAAKKLAAKSSTETQLAASVVETKPAAKKVATKTKAPKKEVKKIDGTTLSTIAAQLDMNPKVARAKLRRAELDPKDGRWVFTDAQVTKIKELLKGDARKKKD